LYKETGLVTHRHVEGLQWARLKVRMFESRTPKILETSVGGRRSLRKLRNRWEDVRKNADRLFHKKNKWAAAGYKRD
jgi:hypothetical protein